MSTILKIIATLIIVLTGGFVMLLAIAIAGSSHSISEESRKESFALGIVALCAGLVLIVLVWLPWKRMLK